MTLSGDHLRESFFRGFSEWPAEVATAMKKFAAERDPDLYINVGDNFYWGGVGV